MGGRSEDVTVPVVPAGGVLWVDERRESVGEVSG